MKICIIGLGYIGLPTAAMFAGTGCEVLGVDISSHAVDTVNRGEIHIVEPELATAVRAAVSSGKLRAATTPGEADVFVICVPTPFMEDHEPDMACVRSAARSIAPFLRKGNVVILESTSPVGSTQMVGQLMAELRPDLSFPKMGSEEGEICLAYCPERVLPGHIMRELVENDRIVGGINRISAARAADVYRTFVRGELLLTDAPTAEMSKLTENAFRDVNIAFANELSLICQRLGIDVWELIELANHHPRVNILQPGPGVGGHCIAVDPWFIVSRTPDLALLTAAARRVNDGKADHVTAMAEEALAETSRPDAVIACLGLAFKPDIDDLRESPAVKITQSLALRHPGKVLAAEPNIAVLPESLASAGVRLVSPEEALRADVVLLLVDHREFRAMKPEFLPSQILIDTRGIWRHCHHSGQDQAAR